MYTLIKHFFGIFLTILPVSAFAQIMLEGEIEIVHTISCHGSNDGALKANINGNPTGLIYQWSNGASTQSIINLSAGMYQVTVSNSAGSSVVLSETLTQPDPLQASHDASDPLCYADFSGSIQVFPSGGTLPYTVTWNDGFVGDTRNGLASGTYTYVILDQNNCLFTALLTLFDPPALEYDLLYSDPRCHLSEDGVILLSVFGGSPPLEVLWSDGVIGTDRFDLPSGNYGFTITDIRDCSVAETITIIAPPALDVAYSISEPLCRGLATGEIYLDISGGLAPYFTVWPDGSQGFEKFNLPGGSYEIEIYDENQCLEIVNVTLEEPDTLIYNVSTINIVDDQPGNINVIIEGGTPPYYIDWQGPDGFVGSDFSFNVFEPGSYQAELTDENGCSWSFVVIVELITSTRNHISEFDISIYPNPTSESITLKRATSDEAEFHLLDMSGKVIYSRVVSGHDQEVSIRLDMVRGGTYITKWSTAKEIFWSKLIKID